LNIEEKEKITYLLENDKFNFLYDFCIKDIREYKIEE